MRRNAAEKPNEPKRKSAREVEKGKVDDQICRIIYEHLDAEGYWRLESREELIELLREYGGVNLHVVRGFDNQMREIESAFDALLTTGRVFFTETDGVCELSREELRLQRIAARAWSREREGRQADRLARRARERHASAT